MNTYTNDKFTLVLFVIYTIFYEFLIWGLTASAIYFLNWSEWTVLVAICISSLQLKYSSFYVKNGVELEYTEESIKIDLDKK